MNNTVRMLNIILETTNKINFKGQNQSISNGRTMLNSFEKLASLTSDKLEKNESIKFETKRLALLATKPSAEKSINILIDERINTVNIQQIDFKDNIIQIQNHSSANSTFLGSIYVRKEVLQEKNECTYGLYSYYIKENDFLFKQSKSVLLSNVLGLSCGKHKIENLKQPVQLVIPYKIYEGRQNEWQDSGHCSYWQSTRKRGGKTSYILFSPF